MRVSSKIYGFLRILYSIKMNPSNVLYLQKKAMWVWIVFFVFILAFLALDLGVFNKNAHVISSKEAGVWTAIWVYLLDF